MKKSLIFKILYLFLILIVIAGASVFATNTYLASQVSYGSTNVEIALNELYKKSTTSKKEILFQGVLNTVNASATLNDNASNYDLFIVSGTECVNSIISSEDIGTLQQIRRESDSHTSYYSIVHFTLNENNIIINSKFESNVKGYITRVIGIKL